MGVQNGAVQGCIGRLVASHELTTKEDQKVKPVTLAREVVAFFIGGAGDSESYYFDGPSNYTLRAMEALEGRLGGKYGDKFQPYYMGYNDAKGDSDLEEFVFSRLPHKSAHVYIVGHSLGGWNGAHLSQILTDKGYIVKMLVTLDPVGEGVGVALISDIYWSEPTPKAETWINVRAEPAEMDRTDFVAWLGGKWDIESGPDVMGIVRFHHYSARILYETKLECGQSALDLSAESIAGYLGAGQ
ncbi:alpha/beta hydrolase [Pseudomonas sp. TNT2022 ID233]|uniref:alpha/beta hydrolase n=1 Tax=Pseudomonas aphyarum TaxID=2942629 RepID=UPI0023600903|nr:alpha/beta hydrolase [Pseudomonas aphyarum]MDD1141208.1 alpha/beta hydrolase [Pseudomonas aphyarum]